MQHASNCNVATQDADRKLQRSDRSLQFVSIVKDKYEEQITFICLKLTYHLSLEQFLCRGLEWRKH
jgi:hypothetical protein